MQKPTKGSKQKNTGPKSWLALPIPHSSVSFSVYQQKQNRYFTSKHAWRRLIFEFFTAM